MPAPDQKAPVELSTAGNNSPWWRSRVIGAALLPIAVGAGVGVWLSAAGSPHAHSVRSSGVAACDLLSAAQVQNLVHRPLSKAPHPRSTDVPAFGYDFSRNGGPYTVTKTVNNLDTCQYSIREPGLFPGVETTVVPADQLTMDAAFADAATHTKRGKLTFAPLPGVGDKAALIQGDFGPDLTSYDVVIRRGAWALQVITINIDTRTTVDVARTLANAPRLQRPPG